MDKKKVKVIIGANYGDEGKGLATNYFSSFSHKCLNVLFNGGCQRGHTVELIDGTRHVFHHFGSGTFNGANTYFDQNFILNPIMFCQEYDELKAIIDTLPQCYVSPECRVSTPYDVFVNQIVETVRGENRHGSCGWGIWETTQRYKDEWYNRPLSDLALMSDKGLWLYFANAACYAIDRLATEYNISYEDIPEEYKKLFESETLKLNFILDFKRMISLMKFKEFNEIASEYDTIIFEGGQGIALDENNVEEYPNVTASSTTSNIPMQRIKDLDCDVEICYITRSYFTRHGAGKFLTECAKSEINPDIEDKTNVYNDYQESIRYGLFSLKDFEWRIFEDFHNAWKIKSDIKCSVFITHLNYTNGNIAGDCDISDIIKRFDISYLCDEKYGMYVIKKGNTKNDTN